MNRRISRTVYAGKVPIGGGSRITVQSMLNVPASDMEGSVRQAEELERAGCELIRAAIPDMDAVRMIPAIKRAVKIPLVADIHFDYRLALAAAEAGVDKIRINPGNIGSEDRVEAVAKACRERGIPIRIGVNSGSLEKEFLKNTAAPRPRRSAKARFTMRRCWNGTIFTTSCFPSSPPTWIRRSVPTSLRQSGAIIRFTSA